MTADAKSKSPIRKTEKPKDSQFKNFTVIDEENFFIKQDRLRKEFLKMQSLKQAELQKQVTEEVKSLQSSGAFNIKKVLSESEVESLANTLSNLGNSEK